MKLFSILLAVLAWASIMNLSDPYISVTLKGITVQKYNEAAVTDENMIYDVVSGENVNITFNGPRSAVQNIGVSDIDVYVDLRELSITNSCPIHVEFKDEEDAKNVKITSKSSEVMKLSLEQMVSENKQVIVETQGTAASGYYAVVTVSPSTLEVFGSENAVSSVERLVAKVDINDVSESKVVSAEVYPVDKTGEKISSSGITIESGSVDATITVYPTRNVNIVITPYIDVMRGFTLGELKSAPNSITIAGPESSINRIAELRIPYSKQNVNEPISDNIDLTQYLPDDCYLVSTPDFVSVTVPVIRLDQNKIFTVKLSEVELRNLGETLKLENVTDELKVSVWGTEEGVAELTAEDLGLYLDLFDIKEPGNYKISLGHKENKNLLFGDTEADVVIVNVETEKEDEKQENQADDGEDKP